MITQEFLNKLKRFDPTNPQSNIHAIKLDLKKEGAKRK